MNVTKWYHSEKRIAIKDESQGSIVTNWRCDELLYYTFIIHSAGEIIFNIGEHFAKLIVKKYQTAVDQFWLTDWQTDAISDLPTADHVQHFAATDFLCCGTSVQWVMIFLYGRCKRLFVSELNNA